MAKITISIEDIDGGKVRIVSTPSFETVAKMINSGESVSDAHGYALAMLRRAREISKEKGPIKILIPRLGRN